MQDGGRHIAVVYAYIIIQNRVTSSSLLYRVSSCRVSFKVLEQVQGWRYWRLQRRFGAPIEPEEAAAGSGFDANKVL